ncbi:gp13 [Rhodococcus phage ReqiPine5]|uniref:Gp13 n=1 Tax=Rhodococcus phage ReqiPine5 TaxID=691963 RepID=D4P7Y8_9CAUD|nr:gp13 [Rhodococcus phage ReqiPine5]ADD81118.1 gp13 [Rhodococcus phage ReqiPine5]
MGCSCGGKRVNGAVAKGSPSKSYVIQVVGPDGEDLGVVNFPLEAADKIRRAGGGTSYQVEIDPTTGQPIEASGA